MQNQRHTIRTNDTVLRKIYLSLYLKVSKGLLKILLWEAVGDRTELQHIEPPLLWPSALRLSRSPGLLNRRPGGPAFYWVLASLPHLVSNSSGLQTNWLPVSPSYIIVQSPTQSLEWHVWSSSSGNNCHAVHRSHSSGASVYECTMGFYLVPYCQPSPPTRFLLITAIGMCHFLPVHHFGMVCLAGSKVNIKHLFVASLSVCRI